jgi:major membrane immunogen (membrane-anchored lipoprotein)
LKPSRDETSQNFEDPKLLFYAYDYKDVDGNEKSHNNETNQ